MNTLLAVGADCLAVQWQHPAGMVTADTLKEMSAKQAAHEWARNEYESLKKPLEAWLEPLREELAAVFPARRANVYHNFSCPDDRSRMEFGPRIESFGAFAYYWRNEKKSGAKTCFRFYQNAKKGASPPMKSRKGRLPI